MAQQQQFQGRLLLTVIDANIENFNYNTQQQHIQNIQNIANTINPVQVVNQITTAITGTEKEHKEKDTIFCTVSVFDQVTPTKKVPKSNTPRWDSVLTFNVYDPFEEVSFVVTEDDRNFAKAKFSVHEHSLVDQKGHELTLPIQAVDSQEVLGSLRVNVQYKYRKTWEALYKGTTALARQEFPAAVAFFTHHLANQASHNTPTASLHYIYDYRCEAFCGMNKLDEALADAAQVLSLRPGYIPAFIRLARVYVLRAEFAEAEKVLARAQAVAPDDVMVAQEKQICANEALIYRVNRRVKAAYIEFNKSQFATAITLFNDTLQEVSNSPNIYLYRGLTYAAAGQIDSCMDDINRMLELQPGWPRTNPTLEGSMKKRGGVNVMMKRRWFILKHCFLFYYKGNNDVLPQGIICLCKATCTAKGRKDIFISIENSKRVYEIKSDEESERDRWHKVLTAVITAKLALPEAEDASQLVANSREIVKVNVATDIFNILQDGFFLPTKVATSIGEKIISSLSPFELESTDKRGWLFKKGRLTSDKDDWARRFFVLKPPYLYYLTPAQDEDLSDGSVFVPRGYISLEKSTINVSPKTTAQAFTFEIIPKPGAFIHRNIQKKLQGPYVLSAETKADFDSWITAIKKITNPNDNAAARTVISKVEKGPQDSSLSTAVDRPVHVKPVNYISDYKPPTDNLTFENEPTKKPAPAKPSSKNADDRFYKFGRPEGENLPAEKVSLLDDGGEANEEGGEEEETPVEEKSGCCCTIL